MRVEHPRELARLLFDIAVERDPAEFDRLDALDEEKWVNVKNKMPVYILYFTAWARPDGVVNFYGDIYRRDRELRDQVDERLITGAERRLRAWMQAAERNRQQS